MMKKPDMSVFATRSAVVHYAESHHAVVRAAQVARATDFASAGRQPRSLLERAVDEAHRNLAMGDDANIDIRAEYAEMLATTDQHRRLRAELGPIIRTACQFRGRDSETVAGERGWWRILASDNHRRYERTTAAALSRLEEAERRNGLVSKEAVRAAWRLGDRYRKAFRVRDMAELYERKFTELRQELGGEDPAVSRFASAAATECLETGEVEIGGWLFEHHLQIEIAALADWADNSNAAMIRAYLQNTMAAYHLYNGHTARAEPLIRQVTETTTNLLRLGKQLRGAANLAHQSQFQLGDCFAVQGKWSEADRSYRAAYRTAYDARPDDPVLAHYFATIVYAGQAWGRA